MIKLVVFVSRVERLYKYIENEYISNDDKLFIIINEKAKCSILNLNLKNVEFIFFNGRLTNKLLKKIVNFPSNFFDNLTIIVNENILPCNPGFCEYYSALNGYENIEFSLYGIRKQIKSKKVEFRNYSGQSFEISINYTIIKQIIFFIDICVIFSFLSIFFKIINKILPNFIFLFSKIGVVHLPLDIAFVPSNIVRILSERGFKSRLLNFSKMNFIDSGNIDLDSYFFYSLKSFVKYIYFVKSIFNFKIFHYHFGGRLFNEFNELEVLKSCKRKIIGHFHGCDIRIKSYNIENYEINVCNDCEWTCNEFKNMDNYNNFKKYADKLIIAIPDIIDFCPDAELILNPCFYPINKYEKNKKDDVITIIHCASYRKWKGSDYLIKACDTLNKEGYKINLIIVENTPHNEAMKIYDTADIAVDQLVHGWYGVFALEMLARGITTLSFIRENLLIYSDKCPIINADKNNIYFKLKDLLDTKSYLSENSKNANINYVKRVHSNDAIADKLLILYKTI